MKFNVEGVLDGRVVLGFVDEVVLGGSRGIGGGGGGGFLVGNI